jgi:LPXTG-motif cell wall-anchored protein
MTSRNDPVRSLLSAVAGIAILGSLVVIVFGIGGRSPRTPTPLEIVGYDGPIWLVLLGSGAILLGGIGLTLALKRKREVQ